MGQSVSCFGDDRHAKAEKFRRVQMHKLRQLNANLAKLQDKRKEAIVDRAVSFDKLKRRGSRVFTMVEEVRLPLLGVLQGRLTKERLEHLWDTHDTFRKGEKSIMEMQPLFRDIITHLPDILEESIHDALYPLHALAEACLDDPLYKAQAEQAHEKLEREFKPVIEDLWYTIENMNEQRMKQLLDTLSVLFDNECGSMVRRDDFVRLLVPRVTHDEITPVTDANHKKTSNNKSNDRQPLLAAAAQG